ncbi:killer cell lectin-like receptor subfamily B member 1C isoform X1, partial [Clarias magur]
MDSQKATEVEIKELTLAEVKYDKVAEKNKVEGTKDIYRKLQLYKRISVFCLVLTLLLLAVVLVLAIKLNERKSIPKFPEADHPTEEKKSCYPVSQGNQCSECAEDWHKTNAFCIYFESENKGEKKEKEITSEGNVYSTLNAEDVDKGSKTTSFPKGSEEAEKKAEGKEKDIKGEETNVYTKLKTPTEDVYNVSKPSSSPKRGEEEENVKEEDDETDLYCKLNIPSENVYMAAGTSSRDKEDVYRKFQLYRRISFFLLVLTLILLAVVLALAMKLNENKSIQKCPDSPSEDKNPTYHVSQGSQCSECGKDWLRVNTSCYFFAKERLNWHESREACQKKGGDLVVIDNENLQVFLAHARSLLYWIGLHYSENKWMWVNNTALTK